MKISAKIRYAVRTLVEIGKRREKTLSLSEVEKKQKISAKFTRQILQPLERYNIVGSKRGAKGGYFLKKKPSKIFLIDIINAFSEQSITIVPCLSKNTTCEREDICGAKIKWEELHTMISNFFKQTTIQDVIDKEKT